MTSSRLSGERLLFRRQFILGPRPVVRFPAWSHLTLGRGLQLTSHPDLQVCQARSEERCVTLLGFVLNPNAPEASDRDIVQGLLAGLEMDPSPAAWIKQTDSLAGRWVLIAERGQACWLLTDPLGYRQVFYTPGSLHGVWAASQTGILSEELGLEEDPEAVAFIRALRRRQPEYYFPGDTSPFKEIRHLLPNHYLDLRSGSSRRFWPAREIPPRPAAEVAKENARILQNIVASACHRTELALTLTAGKDTRLLLAASKAPCHEIYYNTWRYWDMTQRSPDIQIPSRLLARLGLEQHVIRCPVHMNRRFRATLRRNVPMAHDAIGVIAQGLLDGFPAQRLQMMGDGIPVSDWGLWFRARLQARDARGNRDPVTPDTLAWLTDRGEPFALEAFRRWLSDVKDAKVDVLDLFGWEDTESNFVGMTQAEMDVAHDVLVPYCCRRFLENMLSAPPSSREQPRYELHRLMLQELWPDVLVEPINPPVKPTLGGLVLSFLFKPGGKSWRRLWAEFVRYREAA